MYLEYEKNSTTKAITKLDTATQVRIQIKKAMGTQCQSLSNILLHKEVL